jgi:hypothetical protein
VSDPTEAGRLVQATGAEAGEVCGGNGWLLNPPTGRSLPARVRRTRRVPRPARRRREFGCPACLLVDADPRHRCHTRTPEPRFSRFGRRRPPARALHARCEAGRRARSSGRLSPAVPTESGRRRQR